MKSLRKITIRLAILASLVLATFTFTVSAQAITSCQLECDYSYTLCVHQCTNLTCSTACNLNRQQCFQACN